MGDPVTINLRHVARGLGIPLGQVQAVLELLDDGNTVPFITRYRKDQTGGLDEEQIRRIQIRLTKLRILAERKQTILRSIEAQGKLTEKLSKQIRAAGTTKRLEDLYLPYKPKKQTLATVARSRGLEPLAAEILAAAPGCADIDARAADFVSSDRKVLTPADALLGAGHILAEQFSERADLRQRLREILQRDGKLVSTRIGGEPKAAAERPEKPQTPETPQAETKTPAPETAAPEPSAPEPSASETAASETPAPETPTPETPAPETAAPETAAPETAAPETPAPETPAPETPAPETPAPETPASETPAPETAAPETAAPETPSSERPPADPPSEEPPAQPPPPPAEPAASEDPSADSEVESEASAQPAESEPEPAQPPVQAELVSEPVAEVKDVAESPPKQPAAPKAEKPPAASKPRQAKANRKLSKKEQRKKKAEEKLHKAFSDYFEYNEEIKKIPPHRILAINRGERGKVLRIRVECNIDAMYAAIDEFCVPPEHPHPEFLRGCARDALTRLVLPSLEREIRRELTERAETHAVGVFARNLRNLLLQPPIRERRVLAVDPGYRSGCKLAALDQFGNPLFHDVIYLVGRAERKAEAKRTVTELIDRFDLSVVTIGNGTACREAEDFFAGLIAEDYKGKGLAYVIVNEAGASVYSTSRLGREEFPEYDASLRGAISIGRRLQDPLSELVKIDPASIGVGLYQHDVKAKHLRVSLDEVVESCVNYVGVDVNTASPALLRYVSGLNQLTARRVYEHRLRNGPFRSREQLREVPGFGEATFVQAAGFLKITGGDNPLDATWIHPESYATASRVMEKLASTPGDLVRKEGAESLAQRTGQQDVAVLVEELGVGALLLTDILAQFARPGRDPREDLPAPVFKHGVLKLEDLESGMELTGTVLNVVDFGAFVDIGMHDSGLVHVSQLADKFVRDPHDVIAVGDVVKVWVVEVDKKRRRVSLTMIAPGTQRTGRRREGQPADGRDADRAKRPAGPQRPASGQRAAGSERSRSERRPRPKGPPRDRGKRPPKSQYRPPKPRKPVTPITDEMKAGKEPMRTFGDLAQFFGPASPAPEPRPGRKRKPQKAKEEAKPAKTETELPKTETEPPKTETDPSTVAPEPATQTPEPATQTPEPTEQAQTPEQEAASGQDEAQAPSEQVQGADDAAQTPSSEQAVSGVDDQTTEEPPQTSEDPPKNTDP